ncbi:unnamed protein product, partial [Notodromas monacha]
IFLAFYFSYPQLKRRPYAYIRDDDVSYFRDLLADDGTRVIADPEKLIQHSCDWLKTLRGSSPLLIFPKSVDEIRKVLAYCFAKNLAVAVQGGNTSMVGGAIPIFDEIILNTSLLNAIHFVDEISGE